MKQPLGVTFDIPDGQDATGVYEDVDGVEVFNTDSPYILKDGKSLQSPLTVIVVGGPRFLDKAGSVQNSLPVYGISPPTPPVPGPLDKDFGEDGLNSLTVEYDLAANIAVLGVFTRFDGTLTGFTATHGGEPLTLLRVDINNNQKTATALFIGNGLTIEPADVVVTPIGGATLGPAGVRVNDDYSAGTLGSHWNGGATGEIWGNTPAQTMDGVGGLNGAIYVGATIVGGVEPTPVPADNYQKLAWLLVFAGARIPVTTWANSGFVESGGVYTHTGSGPASLAYALPSPSQTPFGFEIDVDVAAGSSIYFRLKRVEEVMGQTLQGPYSGVWKFSLGTNNYNADVFGVVGNGDVAIKSFNYIVSPKVVSGVFGRSVADVVDGNTYSLNIPTSGGWSTSVAEVYDVDTPWRNGLFVAGNNAFGWGYASSPIVSAPLGQLINGPYAEERMIAFWEAPDDSQTIVCFSGDMVGELAGQTFQVNGKVLAVLTPPVYSAANDWTLMYLEPHWMIDGQAYVITRVPDGA